MSTSKDILRYNTIELQLTQYLQALDSLIAQKTERLQHAPIEHIHILIRQGRRPEFYARSKKNAKEKRYLNKHDHEMKQTLLQKRLDERLLKEAVAEAEGVRSFLEEHHRLRLILPAVTPACDRELDYPFSPDDLFLEEWKAFDYPKKPFREDQPEYYTDKGERVRSKSEVLLANMLKKNDIPYRYECPLQLRQGGLIHPDFTLLDIRTRRVCYLEHFGMMDDRAYVKDAIERIQNYQRSGLLLGNDLIVSFESGQSPLNIRSVEREILTRFQLSH